MTITAAHSTRAPRRCCVLPLRSIAAFYNVAMCGRYALHTHPEVIALQLGVQGGAGFDARSRLSPERLAGWKPRWNIAPTETVPVVIARSETPPQLHWLRWGLIPAWASDISIGAKLNNARAESVTEKPAFRQAFSKPSSRRGRCLIPADGYFEWQEAPAGVRGARKQPYYLQHADGELLAMAGVWDSWQSAQGELFESFAVLTIAPNLEASAIHERMPVLIAKDDRQRWLHGNTSEASALLRTAPDGSLRTHAVDRRMSSARIDDAQCIAAVSLDAPNDDSPETNPAASDSHEDRQGRLL